MMRKVGIQTFNKSSFVQNERELLRLFRVLTANKGSRKRVVVYPRGLA